MSWLSPAFPVGAFSYSHALEYAVESRLVNDEATLRDWATICLRRETGPVSGLLLRKSWTAAQAKDSDALRKVFAEGRAWVATSEFELETRAQGQAFMTTYLAAWDPGDVALWLAPALADGWVSYPCAVGIAAGMMGVPVRLALIAFFHGLVSNLISAGIRLIPLGQTAGQRVLASLDGALIEAADDALMLQERDVGTAAAVIEWASVQHETQYTRLFRS